MIYNEFSFIFFMEYPVEKMYRNIKEYNMTGSFENLWGEKIWYCHL